MMETMITPQVGMRLRTKKKKRGHKKEKAKKQKNERKREKGQCYYPFTTLVLRSSTMIFMIESLLCCHFHILVGIFHYRTWLVYSNDGLPPNALGLHPNALGLREKASWMHTHLVSFVELSYIYSSSASVACQSILLALASIGGHLHSPLISLVDVRLSPFLYSHTTSIIIFYSTYSAMSMACAHILRKS